MALVLGTNGAARQALYRPLGSAFSGWTQIRIGMFFTFTSPTSDDAVGSSESFSISTYNDYLTMGLNVDNATLPGQSANSAFIGLVGCIDQTQSNQYSSGAGNFSFNDWVSAFTVWGAITGASGGSNYAGGKYSGNSMPGGSYPTPIGSSGYCGFYGLQMTIVNPGASNQYINFWTSVLSPMTGTDYSYTQLRYQLQASANSWSAAGGNGGTYVWNTGSAARAIPNYLWIRSNFNNNRLRLSCIDAVRML
jgi:hypothetical protein